MEEMPYYELEVGNKTVPLFWDVIGETEHTVYIRQGNKGLEVDKLLFVNHPNPTKYIRKKFHLI